MEVFFIMKTLEELKAEKLSYLSAAKTICDTVDREDRDFTKEERTEVQSYMGKSRLIQDQITALDPDAKKKQQDQDDEMRSFILKLGEGIEHGKGRGKAGPWSTAFLKDRQKYGAKELLTPSGSVGVPALSETIPAAAEALETILQALIPTPTSNSSIEYLREVTRTHAAAPVAAGAVKPTSVYELIEVEAPCETIAHLSEPVKRQWLSDAANLKRYLDSVLRQGEQLALEDQIVNGSGTTPELQGMLTVNGHILLPWDNISDAITMARRGITYLELQSLPATDMVFCVNPLTWESIELIENDSSYGFKMGQTTEGRAPIDRQRRQLWGVPVVPIIGCPEEVILLFHKSAVELFEREGITIDWSENTISIIDGSPVSDFTRNLIRFRAEGRYCLAIYRPEGIVEIVIAEAGS
jgi:HK97 family phage major capsid protein